MQVHSCTSWPVVSFLHVIGNPPYALFGVMAKDTASIRTLRRALATVGSEERLAAELKVSPLDLVRWISGEKAAPPEVFIAALDIVATSWPRTRRGAA